MTEGQSPSGVFLINLFQNPHGLLNRFIHKLLHPKGASHVHRVVVVNDFDDFSCGTKSSQQTGSYFPFSVMVVSASDCGRGRVTEQQFTLVEASGLGFYVD